MGHSTGCQDGMHYLVSPKPAHGHDDDDQKKPAIDGLILQAPVSDRDAMPPSSQETTGLAQGWVEQGKGGDCLPFSATKEYLGKCPVTANRWLSLASPIPGAGADDYFSEDLPDQKLMSTFGRLPQETPLLILFGEKDEYVKKGLDAETMIKRWMRFVQEGGGVVDPDSKRLLEGASHNLNKDPDTVIDGLCTRVLSFLARIEQGNVQ